MRKTTLVLFSLPVLLAGCGEGYEWQLTDTHFPYGNQRTAGSGVAYVLVKMMPEKTLNLQPVQREMEARPIEPQPQAVEKVLGDKLKK